MIPNWAHGKVSVGSGNAIDVNKSSNEDGGFDVIAPPNYLKVGTDGVIDEERELEFMEYIKEYFDLNNLTFGPTPFDIINAGFEQVWMNKYGEILYGDTREQREAALNLSIAKLEVKKSKLQAIKLKGQLIESGFYNIQSRLVLTVALTKIGLAQSEINKILA